MTNPFQGTLDDDALASALRDLHTAEATGVLHVKGDGRETSVSLRRGRIVSVSSGTEEEELGRVLVDRGRLAPVELERAHRVRAESGRSLAQVLADLHMLERSEIETLRTEIERSVLDSLLSGREGEYRFESGDIVPTSASGQLDLDENEDGDEDEATVREIRPRWIRWAASASPLADLTLSTRESALLDFLRSPANQNLTPAEIVARSPLSDEETIQVLSRLLAAGVLEDGAPEIPGPSDFSSTLAGVNVPSESRWPAAPRPAPPQKLGRFVVERTLGRGSMGAVLLANDPAIDRVVAIKLIQTAGHLSTSQSEKYRERFYREASAAGQLLHPNIATVFDVGHTDDGTPFIVMEYVKGTTLREALETETFSVADTIQIARDLLEALRFAHSQGIVHRDVKPSNIMVTPDRHCKIMDFGIAHVVGSELTSAEDVLGSPYYMAPEQLSKGPIGPHTDLFSCAVVLYRMLTGVLPFTGESFAAIAHAILHENPAAPELFSPQIPKGLSRIVLRCLDKATEDRYRNADQVIRALDDAASGKEVPSLPPKTKTWRSFGAGRRFYTVAALIVLGLLTIIATQIPLQTSGVPASSTSNSASYPRASPSLVAPPPAPVSNGGRPAETAGARPGTAPAPVPVPVPTPAVEPSRPAVPKPKPKSPLRGTSPSTEGAPPREPSEATPESADIPSESARAPSVADLFYQARLALERGELEEAKVRLDALLERDPAFAGGAELFIEVTDQIWERSLPIVVAARHAHRLGSCEGEVSLAPIGVRFHSEDHDYAFAKADIRVLERPDDRTLVVETFEKDLLGLGKNKRYRFELETPLPDDDWVRYQRLIK
jgi:eukaryotic-like serine/threonine-protein kinase